MPSVLIVDDEADLAELVRFNLQQAGIDAQVALSAEQAFQQAKAKRPDLVVLDLMLPDMSGVEICQRLRADPKLSQTIVLMLTAKGDEQDRVRGFEAGADDYVTKPFSVRELVLRVKALLRRNPAGISGAPDELRPITSLGLIRLDPNQHRCFIDGEEVALTVLEFRLLHHLMQRVGIVQPRERLLEDVWGLSSALETRTIDTHVMRLRDKLGKARGVLETVRGVGYRLVDSTADGSR